jgi:predicted RNase H-like HicB family nuclease
MFVHRAGESDARGKTAAAALLADPAIPMQRSVTYTVIISRHPRGFVAACPAFKDCVTLGRSRSGAYKSIKDLIRKRLAKIIEDQTPPPADLVVSVKHLRLNLLDIEKEVNLR